MLNMRQAAEYLGVPHTSLQTYWKRWEVPAYRIGKHVQFRERDLESWLQKRVIPVATSAAR